MSDEPKLWTDERIDEVAESLVGDIILLTGSRYSVQVRIRAAMTLVRDDMQRRIVELEQQLADAESFIPGPYAPGEHIYTKDTEESLRVVEYWRRRGKME